MNPNQNYRMDNRDSFVSMLSNEALGAGGTDGLDDRGGTPRVSKIPRMDDISLLAFGQGQFGCTVSCFIALDQAACPWLGEDTDRWNPNPEGFLSEGWHHVVRVLAVGPAGQTERNSHEVNWKAAAKFAFSLRGRGAPHGSSASPPSARVHRSMARRLRTAA